MEMAVYVEVHESYETGAYPAPAIQRNEAIHLWIPLPL